MNHIRSTLAFACLAAVAATAGAQGLRPGAGITDIMRATPRVAPGPATAAPGAAPVQRAAEYIVVLVNSEPITNTEVQTRILRVLQQNPQANDMPRAEVGRLVLEQLINERAQLQEAKQAGIRIADLALDQAEENVARQNQMSVAELRRRLAADGLSHEVFRTELRNEMLLTRLRDREVGSRVKISDVEVDQFLEEQRQGTPGASVAPNLNLAQLLVAVPENAGEAQVAQLQQRAEDLVRRARAGEDFARLVDEFSDAGRENGGVMGLRSAERYPSLFVEATQSTAVNGIAGPARSGAGFHVLKVLAKSQPGAADAVVTQTQVRHILLRNDPDRSTAEAVAQLAEFKRRIDAGTADFAGLARDNSQDGSAAQGGDLGWTAPGQFVPEFEEAVERLEPGQVSEPVVSRFGVHLIQVMGRREARLSQAEQREAARAVLREKRLAEAFETWAQETRARAYVEYRERD